MKSLFLTLGLIPLTLIAAEPDLRSQLRDALYAEEVERDPAKAAESYEKILADFDQQRPLAASALFRLAEVRRKQEKNDDAIALYQRLLREFPDFEAESKLAREHLAELGGDIPEAGEPSPENEELARLKQLKENAPDIFLNPGTLDQAIAAGQLPPIRFLLENGADPNTQTALVNASRSGFLEVCKLLFEHGLKPDKNATTEAIRVAYEQKHLALLSYLLEQLLNPKSPHFVEDARPYLPFNRAIRNWDLKGAELFLKYGADLNRFDAAGPFTQDATPLHTATLQDDLGGVEFLLKNGAKPDLPSPDNAISPLHLAVQSKSTHSMKILKLLLDKGADPNRKTESQQTSEQAGTSWINWDELKSATPLEIALRTNQPEKVKILLTAGVDPNKTWSELTLDQSPGCDDPFAEQPGKKLKTQATLLYMTSREEKDFPAFKLLLDAGARPGPELSYIISQIAKWDEDGIITQKLLTFAPDRFNIDELPPMEEWTSAARRAYLTTVVYPALSKPDTITLFSTTPSFAQVIASDTASSKTPKLENLFIDHFDLFTQDYVKGNKTVEWWAFLLIRRDDAGTWIGEEIDLIGDAPFPELRGGDIIARSPSPDQKEKLGLLNEQINPLYRWSIQKRISFPISLTIGDKTREITLRGDRLIYDPTKPEAPLQPAGKVIELVWPRVHSLSDESTVEITRDDWPLIRFQKGSPEWNMFKLQRGDKLTLTEQETEADPGVNAITLTTPGTNFTSTIFLYGEQLEYPTLVEVLADLYAPWSFKHYPEVAPEVLLASISAQERGEEARIGNSYGNYLVIPTILPNPDLSAIRIHRTTEDKTETLNIDLAAAIASCTDSTSPADARKSDITLQAGDRIELPLIASTEAWTGFTPDQCRFFGKVLSSKVIVTDRNETKPFEINWQPTNWIQTQGGLLPFAPESGFASTNADRIFYQASVIRHGTDFGRILPNFFIRNGDQIRLNDHNQRMPRARAVIPPSPSR